MGSASSRKRLSTQDKGHIKPDSNVKSNNQSPIKKVPPSCKSPADMAKSNPAQVPPSPHLPLLSKTREGTIVPQSPPSQEEPEGYETPHALYNLINDGFRLPFIHVPEYMLILDLREQGVYAESHILTARPHTAIDSDRDCLLEAGKLKKFTHIVLYDDRSTVADMSEALKSLADRLRAQELDPVILIGGFHTFYAAYPFLCNDRLILSERDRAREIRTYPSEILEGALYQGSAKHSNSREVVKNLRITHIVNITTECTNAFEGECKYLQLKFTDELRSNMKHRLPAAADFIAEAVRNGGRILVHCVEGISRSSTITLAFLMKYHGWSLKDGLDFLRSKRPIARPNRAFLIQLSDLEKDLFGRKISDVDEIYMS